ncbi:MAG: virulence RhuM family protein [Melioribacteraceae bacterium]|nr:virulence RhuM family protein [Melioribacteraceae bacterium]
MDDERLKNPDGRPDYFDELKELEDRIKEQEK